MTPPILSPLIPRRRVEIVPLIPPPSLLTRAVQALVFFGVGVALVVTLAFFLAAAFIWSLLLYRVLS